MNINSAQLYTTQQNNATRHNNRQQVGFGDKYNTADIIKSVVGNANLPAEAQDGFYKVGKFMLNLPENHPHLSGVAMYKDDIKQALIEQHPRLASVAESAVTFFGINRKRTLGEVSTWINTQVQRHFKGTKSLDISPMQKGKV